MLRIGFIGAGTVGTALAVLLSRSGYQVAGAYSRSRASAERLAGKVKGGRAFPDGQSLADEVEMVFITTPDDAIATVASQLGWHAGQSVVHCSGAASLDILEPAARCGALTGSIHPLQTLAGVEQALENIPGSTFALEARGPLLGTLKQMATALGGTWIELKAGDKVLYHAAAVLACNYLVTLVKLATDLWQTFGVPPEQATRALLPLLRGTLHNIESVGIPRCLTGPIARGDSGTIQKHLEALRQSAPQLLSTYRELGLQTIPVSAAKGKISEDQAQQMRDILKKVMEEVQCA